MEMVIAVGHLFATAADAALGYMGTTGLAVVVSVVLLLLRPLWAFFRSEMRQNWKANVFWSVVPLMVLWVLLIGTACVRTVYKDHISERAHFFTARDAIDGSGGYKKREEDDKRHISDLMSKLATAEADAAKAPTDGQIAESKFDTLKAARQPNQLAVPSRDPDGFYQNDMLVGTFVQERIDYANGVIDYQAVRTSGQFNSSQEAVFRHLIIRCPNVVGGPPPGTIAGAYIGMTVGGACSIIRPVSQP